MNLADAIIRTKINLPVSRPGLVVRPKLRERILQGLLGPLTLVVAPAGFGKTTLVASCIADRSERVAWLSLDKQDNQPGRFLTYLVAALQSADVRIGSDAAQLMASIQPARSEAVLTSLINDLDASGSAMTLVLDDYHLIDHPAVHDDLAFFLNHLPGCFHLVISTRSDPPLPLARMRARGQLVELRAADLRFTQQEAALFLNEGMGLRLDECAIAALEARTEGWIAGLQMAALSIKDREDPGKFIESFSGTNRYILDYLMEEVLARQPAEIQTFLLYTSILDRLSAPLCDALLAESSMPLPSAEVLNLLERENLFLLPLDQEHDGASCATWFRYHHLFADLLRARLRQSHPGLADRLHIQASTWLEHNGWIGEAIQHLLAARAFDQAADRIEKYGSVDWAEHGPSIIQQAESLPPDLLLRRPRLGLYFAWLLICHAHIDKALPLLYDLAAHLATSESDHQAKWVQTVIQCALAFLKPPGSHGEAFPLPASSDLENIPVDEPILRDAAEVLYGMALARLGDLDGAVAVSLRCIEMAAQRIQPLRNWSIPSVVPFLARIYLFQGRLFAAQALCREYLQPYKTRDTRLVHSPGSLETVWGEVLYHWNRLEEAEQHLRAAQRANEPWDNVMTDGFGAITLALVLQARGDIRGAMQTFEAFKARMDRKDQPREFGEALRTLDARLLLAAGDLEDASHWFDQVSKREDFHLHTDCYHLIEARIRLAEQRFAEVETLLKSKPYLEVSTNRLLRQIEIHLLRGLAAAGQKQMPAAFDHLTASLALAEPEGYVRVFLDEGRAMQRLLAQWCEDADAGRLRDYGTRLLSQFDGIPQANSTAQDAASPNDGLIEPLSPRELEVLGLMALGQTNQQIADRLVVARGTVKAQAVSIFRKLDVSNRTEAVARARQLGVLS